MLKRQHINYVHLPLKENSRKVVFLNTARTENRTRVLKTRSELLELEDNSLTFLLLVYLIDMPQDQIQRHTMQFEYDFGPHCSLV